MATRTTRSDVSPRTGRASREARLAELVAELTSSPADLALDAVRADDDLSDPLEQVARAMTRVRHRPLEPQDRLRVAGFLRPTDRGLPRRTPPGEPRERAEHPLVHHGSLRRWERTGAEAATLIEDPDDPDNTVIDLRDRTARFRRPR